MPPSVKSALKFALQQCNDALQEVEKHQAAVTKIVFDYPTHPFPADLLRLITDLPDGFVELALSGRLSTLLITLLQRAASMIKQGTSLMADDVLIDLMNLSTNPETTAFEKRIAILVNWFALPSKLGSRMPGARMSALRQREIPFVAKWTLSCGQELRLDFTVWTTYLIVTTMENGGFGIALQDNALLHLISIAPDLRLDDMKGFMQRFFWRESLEPGLLKMSKRMDVLRLLKLNHEATSPERERA
jgi:hypothetical protein